DQQIDLGQDVTERLAFAFDPEIHGVGGDEPRPLSLREYVQLESRVDVTEQHVRGRGVTGGQLGLKISEHVELRVERGAAGQVCGIAARPTESLAVRLLDARAIDARAREIAQ